MTFHEACGNLTETNRIYSCVLVRMRSFVVSRGNGARNVGRISFSFCPRPRLRRPRPHGRTGCEGSPLLRRSGPLFFFFFFFLSQRLEGEQVCKNVAGALIDQVLQLAFKHGYSRRVSPSFRCGAERGKKMRAEQHGACRCLIELQETRSKINAGRFRYLFSKADTP